MVKGSMIICVRLMEVLAFEIFDSFTIIAIAIYSTVLCISSSISVVFLKMELCFRLLNHGPGLPT